MSTKDNYVVLVQCVNDLIGDKYVLMTSITRKHSTGNTNTTIKMSTIILLTRQEVYYSAAANHACRKEGQENSTDGTKIGEEMRHDGGRRKKFQRQ